MLIASGVYVSADVTTNKYTTSCGVANKHMKKSKTLLIGKDEARKVGEGDLVIAFQANRDGESLGTNLDWLFDKETTNDEIKSTIGGFLSSIEEVFGEKMVTEAITHYAEEKNHLVKTPQGAALHFKSKGLDFKDWR